MSPQLEHYPKMRKPMSQCANSEFSRGRTHSRPLYNARRRTQNRSPGARYRGKTEATQQGSHPDKGKPDRLGTFEPEPRERVQCRRKSCSNLTEHIRERKGEQEQEEDRRERHSFSLDRGIQYLVEGALEKGSKTES